MEDRRDVPIESITVPNNRRKTNPARVKSLADSISEVGLLQRIGLTADLRLIYGRHRLEAYSSLHRPEIPAVIHSLDDLHTELAEIDENLERSSLTAIQTAKALKRRKIIYEALHPETRPVRERGGPGRGNKTTENTSAVSFADDVAAKTNRTSRSVRGDIALAEAIPDDVAEAIADSPLADNKAELKQLAKLPELQQRTVAEKIRTGAGSVQEALTGKTKQRAARSANTAWTCPNCGSHEHDEDGDCKACMEPAHDPPEVDDSPEAVMKAANREIETFCRELWEMAQEKMPKGPWLKQNGRRDQAIQKIKDACSTLRTCKGSALCPKCHGEGCNRCLDTGYVTKLVLEQLK
jgi:ParB-like chromosome segregation protein Spo0J